MVMGCHQEIVRNNAELTTYIRKEATFSTATAVFLAMEFRLLFAAKNENEFRKKKDEKKREKETRNGEE